MHRLLAAPAVAASLLLGISGVALAQDEPSQDCVAKRQQLVAVQADLDAAVAENLSTVPALQTQVDVLIGLVADACPAEQPDPTPDPDEPSTTPDPDEPGADPSDDPDAGTLPVFYADCPAAIAAGAAPIVAANGEPGYRAALDPDGDGVACEADETTAGVGGTDGSGDADRGDDGSDNSGTLGGSTSSGTGTGSIGSIPRGSVDTGYAAP